MQETAFWKCWLFIGILEISLLTVPGWSQQTVSPDAPAPGADAKAYVAFGIYNGSKGNLAAAISAFDDAIRIDPKYAPAYYNRGFAYALKGQVDQAIAEYNQTIKLDPSYRDAYYRRGSLEGEKGDFDGAVSDFNEVIKLDPQYAPAYYNRGHVEYFRGDLNGAHAEIDDALRLDANSQLSYFIHGLIQRAQGNRDQAIADFQKSVGLGFPDAALWVWITETENAQRGAAQQDLSSALAKPALFKSDDWSTQLANFLLGNISQDQLIAQANAGGPDKQERLCEAWFYAGMRKRLSGDVPGAQDCFARALATGAKSSEEYVEAGRAAATP